MVAHYPTMRMNGREYVLVPAEEFKRLTAEDRRAGRKVARAVAKYKAGKLKTVSHAALKRSLGL